MDRSIYYSQEQLRSFDLLWALRDTLVGLGWAEQDLAGTTSTTVAGFAATPTSPATLTVNIGAGRVYQVANLDTTAYGALTSSTAQVQQQGIGAAQQVTLTTSALSSGQSQWALVQAQFSQTDAIRSGDPTGGVLYYFNSSNPSQPFQGPGNSGTPNNTVRQGAVSIGVIYGTPATTGSEVPPNPTAGWVPLYLVDLTFGQTQINANQILTAAPAVGSNVPTNYTRAPFLQGLALAGQYAPDVGAANAYVVGLVPTLGAHVVGMPIRVKWGNTNTGASTINPGPGAVTLARNDGAALQSGDVIAGMIDTVKYDGTVYRIDRMVRSQLFGLAGLVRNLVGSSAGAVKTASWTVDEIIAETALGGGPYKGSGLTLNFNGAGTGAGGMDTGAVPTASALYIYAIYNPTTNTWNTLGTTSGSGATIYPGANMPSGYTASCLIYADITSGGNLQQFVQTDRLIQIQPRTAVSAGTAASYTAVSLSSLVPPNAKSVVGWTSFLGTGNNFLAADANGLGYQLVSSNASAFSNPFPALVLLTPQTIYYKTSATSVTYAINQFTI